MKKNSITEAIYKNAGYIVVVLISVVYVASSLINISRSGKSIYEIVGAGVLSLIVGILINSVFRSIGIKRGEEDEKTVATAALHAKCVDEIVPYIDRLDEFCEMENKRALRTVRTRILAREGLKYSDYFDESGNAKLTLPPSTPLTPPPAGGGFGNDKAKIRAYNKALRVKIKPLMPSNLTSDGAKPGDPFDFGRSKREFRAQRSVSDVAIKILMAVLFGYFGVTLATEVNVASLIWNALQIVLYITGGIIQMYSSYSWVVDDYRGGVVRKIDMLQKFKIYATRN